MLNNVISIIFAGVIVALVSCAAGDGGKEVITSISCKNESTVRIWEARIKVDDRSFGFGILGIGKKATMGVGNISGVRKLTITYAVNEADAEQSLEFSSDKLAALAPTADEVEAVYHGDGKWSVRVYKRRPDHEREVIFEEEVKRKK
jgi:hypothetical protein